MEPSTQDSERGAGKNKRKWSKMEDEKLIEALLELVNAGTHKADNGFRPGYLVILEDALLAKLPGLDLKAMPHIESQIKTLKKDFTTVYDMRFGPTSGFGWNDKTHVVTAPSHVWDAYLKVHEKATKWRYNHFPWYNNLSIIFGKDRATGHDAQTAADVLEELDKEDASLHGAEDGLQDLNFDSSSMLHGTNSDESTSKKSSKKRSRSIDPVAEAIYSASRMIATQLHEIAKMFSQTMCEDNMMEQKKKLNEELSNIFGISKVQWYQAVKKMADNENLIILFFTAPDDEKDDFVQALLRGDI